jgi:hypothetical protein
MAMDTALRFSRDHSAGNKLIADLTAFSSLDLDG